MHKEHGHLYSLCTTQKIYILNLLLGPSRIDPLTKHPLKYLASYNLRLVANTSHCQPRSGRPLNNPRTRIKKPKKYLTTRIQEQDAQDQTPKTEA